MRLKKVYIAFAIEDLLFFDNINFDLKCKVERKAISLNSK